MCLSVNRFHLPEVPGNQIALIAHLQSREMRVGCGAVQGIAGHGAGVPHYQWVWFTSGRAPTHEVVAHSSDRAALSLGCLLALLEHLLLLFYHHHSPKLFELSFLPVFAAQVSGSGGVAGYVGNFQS